MKTIILGGQDQYGQHQRPVSSCCGASILFFRTDVGRFVPVDSDTHLAELGLTNFRCGRCNCNLKNKKIDGYHRIEKEIKQMDNKQSWYRIIGDVHSLFRRYIDIASQAEHSLQVGDLGFDYSPMVALDPERHRVIFGNHDNYTRGPCENCQGDECPVCQGRGHLYPRQIPHCLGDFGTYTVPKVGEIFFVRGAWSIDYKNRTPGLDWWDDEELSSWQMHKAYQLYVEKKPRIVVTHTCPDSVVPEIPRSQLNIFGPILHHPRTERFLDTLFEAHKPEYHFFGHWHRNFTKEILGTTFTCLGELSYADFDENGNLVGLPLDMLFQ